MDERSPEKKQYTVPQLETEEVFQTLALACCKALFSACHPIVGVTSQAQMS